MGGRSAPVAVRIPGDLYGRLIDHLLASTPLEGVGLLAVEGGADGAVAAQAMRFYPGTNVDASPARYTMDPAEVLAAFDDMAAHGWRLGAIVHSHPVDPATPSETDLREAHYPDALMAIVSLAVEPPVLRAWRLAPGTKAVSEAPVEIEPGTG